jgi:hypothetical protein
MTREVFKSGTFKGVDTRDTFARAASEQEPVTIKLGPIAWPAGLAPAPTALGNYAAGTKITGPLQAKADALIILYTGPETQALLDVFTNNNEWSPARSKTWCGYAHNFAAFKSSIENISGDDALEAGMFGYLSAVKIGTKTVVLYKTELHPKQNGAKLPFVGVVQQLITELAPGLVISTGTAGGIGPNINCGDVAVTSEARFHCQVKYPAPNQEIDTMSANKTPLTNSVSFNPQYVTYAASNFTKLSLNGLSQCYTELQKMPGYSFVKKPAQAPAIYVTNKNPAPGPEPMAIVSADYLTVDDSNDSESLQPLGIMNDTDDAFVFYAISKIAGTQPKWLSVRNASEPQIVCKPFPSSDTPGEVVNALKKTAGSIYGIYQYCTTLNSAFTCWGIVAGL